MRCTKADERRLKELQRMQMEEKRCIEREEEDREMMWHHVLMDDYNRKVSITCIYLDTCTYYVQNLA